MDWLHATNHSRREALLIGFWTTSLPHLCERIEAEKFNSMSQCLPHSLASKWAWGIGGQRKADFGSSYYLNPVLAGDHPDPSVLKDGEIYYKVSSSFDYYPGLIIWKSHDLISWSPVGPVLKKLVGSVYAPDLSKT